MAKTITLENPLTMIRKWNAKRIIKKNTKEIKKLSLKNEELQAKFFTPSESKTEEVKTTKAQTKMEDVRKQFDNKIIAKPNTRNSNLHLDKGMIDEVIAMLKTEQENGKAKDFVISTMKNGKTRVFINKPTKLKIARATKFLKNRGWELSVDA